jgi:plastocyanin
LSLALFAHPAFTQTIHQVTVGGSAGLVFTPEAISAQPGDQVVFTFQQKNHTATQSSFANPCGLADNGFDSGFMPVPANQTDNFPTYTVNVANTTPIWVFCDQAANTPSSHCGQGMVFAINCGADGAPNSFTNFKAAALAQGAALSSSAAAASTASGGYGYPTTTASGAGSGTTDYAAYGTYTVPPAPTPSTVTQTITLASSTWTTTYASYPNSPNPTPASLQGNVIQVIVGGNDTLTYDPPHVAAQPFDTIMFIFQSKNHTVTQSAFADPCRKFVNNATDLPGFDSGFMPVPAGATDGSFPVFNLTVNDTAPTWAYCRQKTPASHCGAGMVFAINSDESSQRSFAAFQQLAEELNGTVLAASSSASGSAATPSSTSTRSGASAVRVGSAGVLGGVALLFAALL